VTLEQLRALPRGAPWLSAGLLKLGDEIYLARWDTWEPAPRLLHVPSIQDLELFGVDAGNYSRYVLGQEAWEQQFGFGVDGLRRGVLPRTDGTAPPLAGLLAADELDTFLASALDNLTIGAIVKWRDPIVVEARGAPTPADLEALDRIVAELRPLVAPLEIRRAAGPEFPDAGEARGAPAGGNVVVHFVPQALIAPVDPGRRTYAPGNSTFSGTGGVLTSCTAAVSAEEAEAIRHHILRHELTHCLGLGHNQRPESVLNGVVDLALGVRLGDSPYSAIDRALIRTLYHAAVAPNMRRDQVVRLFV
jgi:hypothetical protein